MRPAVESLVKVLIVHLLEWRYQPARRGASRELSIANARDGIARRLADSPSLRRRLPDMIVARYPNARRHTALETGLPLEALPPTCPFSAEQLLDDDYMG